MMKALAVMGLGLLLVGEGPGAAASPVARAARAKNQTLARERRGGLAAIAKIPGALSSGQFNLVKTFMVESFISMDKKVCERQLDPCPPDTYLSYTNDVLIKKCVSLCPDGFTDHDEFCWKDTTAYDGGHWSTRSCEQRHGRGKCEACGWGWFSLIYKKCPAGYKRYGCNLCKKVCPQGWDDWLGLSCRKPTIDYMGKEDCADVPSLTYTCGTGFCTKDKATCDLKITSVALDMAIMAATIWDMTGTSKLAVAATREAAEQAARKATKAELNKAAKKALAKSATEGIAWNIGIKLASTLRFSDASPQGQNVLNAAALAAGTSIALATLAESEVDFKDVAMLLDPTGFASVVNGFIEDPCPHLPLMECEAEPVWTFGEWSEWSSECGDGKRTRTVTCIHGCEATVLSNSKCNAADKPDTEENRHVGAYAPKWIYGEWRLQDPCGHTKRTRHAECHAVCADCTDELPTEEYFDALCEENPDTYPDPNYAPNSGRFKHRGSNYACRCN